MKRPQSRDQELFVRGKKHEQDINEQTKGKRMKGKVQHRKMCSSLYAWCIIQLPPFSNAIIYGFQPKYILYSKRIQYFMLRNGLIMCSFALHVYVK